MATYTSYRASKMSLLSPFVGFFMLVSADNFYQDVDLDGGKLLTLTLDKTSGSGFKSKREYLFGRIDMQIKLVSGNSAGTVTAYYFSSEGPNHDEVDFEFLGNLSGDPYIVRTNVYTHGKKGRRTAILPLVRPNKKIFTPSLLSGTSNASYNVPIRVFNNEESTGVPFPSNQPMKLYSSLWNADQWVTRGGLEKTDWSRATFTANYRNFNVNGCAWCSGSSCCDSKTASANKNNAWQTQGLDANSRRRLGWVQK